MNATPPDEPEHDAMLRAALRHAPDHDARPPEAVSAQILWRAQQATAVSSSSNRALEAARRWLNALTRPAPAAAFASLMLATVIGVMWQQGPPPERRDPPDTQVKLEAPKAAGEASAGGGDASAGTAADRSPAPRSAEAQTSQTLPKRSAGPPPAPAAPSDPGLLNRSVTPADISATAKARAATGAAAAPSETSARPELRSEQANASDATQPPDATAPAETAAEPARRADDEASHASSRPAARATAEADGKAAGEARATREREAVAAAAPQAAITGRSEAMQARSEAPAPTRNMLAGAADPLAALAALAEGWAATEPQRVALLELRRLSTGRWTRVPISDLPPSSELSRADGRPLGRLAIADDAVLWLPHGADGPAWRAPLEPAAAADLRRRLALPAGR